MVYSTCSLNPMENEAVVAQLLRAWSGALEVEDVVRSGSGAALGPLPQAHITIRAERGAAWPGRQARSGPLDRVRQADGRPPSLERRASCHGPFASRCASLPPTLTRTRVTPAPRTPPQRKQLRATMFPPSAEARGDEDGFDEALEQRIAGQLSRW